MAADPTLENPIPEAPIQIEVRDLTMAYGDFVIQRDLDFEIRRGDIFVVMGGSGCGKTTLLRHMVGLKAPVRGDVYYGGEGYWQASQSERDKMTRRFGVMYQGGALWSSMTLLENVSLTLQEYTDLDAQAVAEIAALKLALVGLKGFEHFYPSEISGGMHKRAGLARAMALDPEILYFDEPSAGLDPISSSRLDALILELRDSLGATVVLVTHELPSILAIGTNSIFLDAEAKTIIASGPPRTLRDECPDERVRRFLNRGES